MAPTIAERAANGEILYAPDLTVEQRRELLVWARDQKMGYKEIKSNYGFEESESTLRGWKRNDIVGNAPREAVFTSTDVSLLTTLPPHHIYSWTSPSPKYSNS